MHKRGHIGAALAAYALLGFVGTAVAGVLVAVWWTALVVLAGY